jgi:thiamine pyrophosphate-dependent acetolactate synthase large subunit-like protein
MAEITIPSRAPPSERLASSEGAWGSDAIVEQLSRLGLRYIALVPGSSYRGMHDSLVNYNGNSDPELILCLHEEHCVALAHGFAKVKERPMAAAVHANVGLMHATMAIYNAFCDRVPIVILGATGPLDATRRRPWIDWIHTATDQAALIRPFIKFDDQPHSVNAAIASLVRATAVASQPPRAPVYVCLDVNLQENQLTDPASVHFPTTERYLQTSSPPGAAVDDVGKVRSRLDASQRPLFLFGRVNRSEKSWDERTRLAERYGARVLTDLKQAAAFPTQHELHACAPGVFNSHRACEVIRAADVIVSFDWVDLAGTLQAAHPAGVEPSSHIVHVSLDSSLHNGWSKDHFGHPPVDHAVSADADKLVSALLAVMPESTEQCRSPWQLPPASQPASSETNQGDNIYMTDLAEALYTAVDVDKICLIRIPLSWKGSDLRATHPLAFLGQDGGAGIGSGPGQAVGAALALKDSGYLPVAVLGDGDFLMGSSALWTAARYRLPLLVIVANNASFYNDEVHQERMARARSRPIENKGIGIRIDDPLPDLSQNAASLGATVLEGQVTSRAELVDTLKKAVQQVHDKKTVVVVDVQVRPHGYSSALEKGK